MKKQTIGSRAEVWHGTAKKTSGGLTKNDLLKNKSGRIVSKSKHNTAKREKRLLKSGYGTQKGKFGFVRLGSSSSSSRSSSRSSRKSRKGRKGKRGGVKRGGGGLSPLSPASISGIKGTSGADIQLLATNY